MLLDGVGSKPVPVMLRVGALMETFSRLCVTVGSGTTVATVTAGPLEKPNDITVAFSAPRLDGRVEKVTVKDVAVADVTVPTAPRLEKTTVLPEGVGSKPTPAMVNVVAPSARVAVVEVTKGVTLATCTAAPLDPPPFVTTALRTPKLDGRVEKVTVKDVAVADVTVPTAPRLEKTTVLLDGVGSKPVPVIVIVDALMEMFFRLCVTVGSGTTVATVTAVPLDTLNDVTMAVMAPAIIGGVENVTMRKVVVEAVTTPTAPLLRTTVLPDGVGSKPVPVILRVDALMLSNAMLCVTLGAVTTFTVVTVTDGPLDKPNDVTMAFSAPRAVGRVEKDTVKDVAVAEVTVPTAPPLNITVLLPGIVASKPVPEIVSGIVALWDRKAALGVTEGGVEGPGVGDGGVGGPGVGEGGVGGPGVGEGGVGGPGVGEGVIGTGFSGAKISAKPDGT